MQELNLKEIVGKNPKIDPKLLEQARAALEKRRTMFGRKQPIATLDRLRVRYGENADHDPRTRHLGLHSNLPSDPK